MTLPTLSANLIDIHLSFRPVDATFMGLPGHDHELPPADADAALRELSALRDLTRSANKLPLGATASERLEAILLSSQLNAATRELEARPRYHNPAWYTGEAGLLRNYLLVASRHS